MGSIRISRRKSVIDADVTSNRPTELFEALPEPGKARLHFRIVLYTAYQNANAARAVRLLRARRERPRRAAPPSSVMNSRRFSFDHLVGAGEQRRRNFEAENTGRHLIDH